MKSPASAASLAAVLALTLITAACAQTPAPRDTGNMAYPAPLPQGNVGTDVGRRPADTGNMAYPPSAGTVGTSTKPTRGADTSSSSYQTPLPQGNIGTTVTK